MLNVFIHLLFIAIIIVVITDISDFPDSVKKGISYILTKGKIVKTQYRLHLIDCSFCQTFWASILYLLITGAFTLKYIAMVCLICAFCDIIKNAILLVEDIVKKIIQLIYKNFIDK